MKKNLYYTGVIQRKKVIRDFSTLVLSILFVWPRNLLEVFIRKSFGERYFSIVQSFLLALFLFLIPISIDKVSSLYGYKTSLPEIFLKNITWYIFLGGFIYYCLKRQKEIKREPGVFDFEKFSLSAGIINPYFRTVKLNGKEVTSRQIATLVEPAFFLVIGIVLTAMMQKVGILLVFSSLGYAGSWYISYLQGDHFIMDKIDQMICNEEMVASFVDGRRPDQTRGFEPFCRRPADDEFRRKVADFMMPEDDFVDAF